MYSAQELLPSGKPSNSMSRCQGELCVTIRVDRSMQEFLEAEAREFGINRAELIRRILDDYRDSRREKLECPHCDKPVVMNAKE